MTHILRTSTEHRTASLADEGNSAYCQSSGAHNINHISDEYKVKYVQEKVATWIAEVEALSEIEKSEPHAAYTAFTHGLTLFGMGFFMYAKGMGGG